MSGCSRRQVLPPRLPAVDGARGLAVACMMLEHLVPTETGAGAGAVAEAAAWTARLAYGKSAPLFCLLLGGSMALLARRTAPALPWRRLLWRTVWLLALGQLLAAALWTTEILMPMGMMTLCCAPLLRRPYAVAAVLLAVLGAAPWVTAIAGDWVEADWLEDGTHRRDHGLGWFTLRYFLVDGNYPLIAWLAFPLLGMLLVPRLAATAKPGRAVALLLPLAVASEAWARFAASRPDTIGVHLLATWTPTSVPFVVVGTFWGLLALAGLRWLGQRGLLTWLRARLVDLGLTSLTHYVLHLASVYVLLRQGWPEEDWPAGVGAAAWAGYLLFAGAASRWWLRRRRRGPLEALL